MACVYYLIWKYRTSIHHKIYQSARAVKNTNKFSFRQTGRQAGRRTHRQTDRHSLTHTQAEGQAQAQARKGTRARSRARTHKDWLNPLSPPGAGDIMISRGTTEQYVCLSSSRNRGPMTLVTCDDRGSTRFPPPAAARRRRRRRIRPIERRAASPKRHEADARDAERRARSGPAAAVAAG